MFGMMDANDFANQTMMVILNDDASRANPTPAASAAPPLPTHAQILRTAFDRAALKGPGVLLDVMYGSHDLFGPTIVQTTLSIQDHGDVEKVHKLFHATGGFITGLYDLQKPFEDARGGPELLPAQADGAIREALYERVRSDLSLWQKLKFRSEERRSAFLQSFEICRPL